MIIKEIRRVKGSAFLALDTDKNLEFDRFKVLEYPHYNIFSSCIQYMGSRGWVVAKDPEIEKRYKTLSKYHRYAAKGLLECNIEIMPIGIHFQFYQNVNTKNNYGGKYDLNKLEMMPYLIRQQFINETNKLMAYVSDLQNAPIKEQQEPDNAVDKIIYSFQTTSFYRNKITTLAEIVETMSDYDHKFNSTDRDGKKIECGQIKYFRCEYTGRIYRGEVWHHINNMWWVIVNRTTRRNIASFHLFDPSLDDYALRRKIRERLPKEYVEKMEVLSRVSTKELVRAINRRKVAIQQSRTHHE